MNSNSKTSIGLLIPATSFIVFIISIYFENFSFSMFSAICGILIWFLYTAVMQTKLPDVTGNIIILFGLLISIGYFLNFGISNNMFGGIDFNKETIIGSLMILLISVVLGVLFNNSSSEKETSSSNDFNSDKDTKAENKMAEPKKELDSNESYPEEEEYDEYYPEEEEYDEYYPEEEEYDEYYPQEEEYGE